MRVCSYIACTVASSSAFRSLSASWKAIASSIGGCWCAARRFRTGETLGDACDRSLHRIKFWCMPRIPLSGVRISCESEAMKSSFAEATRLSSS